MTEPAKKAPAKRAPRVKAQAPQPDPKVNAAQPEVASTAEERGGRDWKEAFENIPIGPIGPIPELTITHRSVHELWCMVMESVRSVAKGDFNEDQGFRFRGVDSVVDAVGPALRSLGVHIRPRRIISQSATEYTTKRGSRMVNRVVHVEWEVTGPGGDSFLGESMGEAADAGDKSLSKAQSVAYRVYLLQALAIPTGEKDPDAEAHERDTPAAGEGYYWDRQQEAQYSRQRPSQDEQRQAQAGEENQAAHIDNAEARAEMWRIAKGLGWEWRALADRFRSDHGYTSDEAHPDTIKAFTANIVKEAEMEEDRAKKVAADELGAKEITDEAQAGGVL